MKDLGIGSCSQERPSSASQTRKLTPLLASMRTSMFRQRSAAKIKKKGIKKSSSDKSKKIKKSEDSSKSNVKIVKIKKSKPPKKSSKTKEESGSQKQRKKSTKTNSLKQ